MRRLLSGLTAAVVCFLAFRSNVANAQTYISAVGNPSFGINLPVPNGYINIANGNLHLEIPLATLKQRGALQLNERLVYDSRIWEIVQYNNYYWWPLNVPNSQAGWRFVKGNETGTIATTSQISNTSCWTGIFNQPYTITTSYYSWTDPNGTVHTFDANSAKTIVPTNCPGTQGGTFTTAASGYATDASGYFETLTTNASGTVSITVKDSGGTQVYPQVIDRFGNFWANDSNNNLVDDLGRTPVLTTVSGNTTYYDVLAPNGMVSNGVSRIRYTVTMAQIPINTAFGQSAVTEYQGNGNPPGSVAKTIPAVQSVGLPDGSSYQFIYDSYGGIQSMTLPTGGVVGFGWTNYQDSYQNVNRWIASSTVDSYTTKYTPTVITQCSSNGTGCKEQVNVHRPSGDETVYTLTLNNGAWDTNTTVYAGAASANQAKLATVNTYDFGHPCGAVCTGAENVTKTTQVDTLPDISLSSQTQSIYQYPQTGQLTSLGQWDFFTTGSTPSTVPTRQVKYGYTGFDLTSENHLDGAGTSITSTIYNYATAAAITAGVVGHGTANAGGPYLTSVTSTNNAPSSSADATVTTSATYEDTGSLLSTQDANKNPITTYKYDLTHTFVTEIDKPSTTTSGTTFQHITKASFDPNSGAILSSDDENSVANNQAYQVKYSYEAKAGRLQQILYPKATSTDTASASRMYSYPNANETDITVAQSASVNVMTAHTVDGYGRSSQTSSGGISSTTAYDGNGRAFSVTNPSNGSGTTIGTTYTYYDALNRVSSIQNPDGTTRTLTITGNTAVATDELLHQNKQVFNAFGELTTVFEADPKTGALTLETDYQHDALGNVVCVEQHGNVAGTGCGSTGTDASSAWRVRRFLYNSLSQLRAASIPEHTFQPVNQATQNCGTGTGGNQWTDCYYYDPNGNHVGTKDNRGVARSYTFDSLNRPLLKTSPSGTTQDFFYDASPNGVGYMSHESNDVNAAATYGYDAMGRLVSESSCRPSNCGTGYVNATAKYDLAGNRLSITYPDGRVVGSTYDGLNRLSTVTYTQWGTSPTNLPAMWSAASYAAPGLLQTVNYGNGMQMQAGYNSRLSLTSLSYQTTSPAAPQSFFSKTYQWDSNATNLKSETNLLNSQQRQFSYDQLNRLTSAADVSAAGSTSTAQLTLSGVEGSSSTCGLVASNASQKQTAALSASPLIGRCTIIWDTGSVYFTVGPFSASVPFGQGSTPTKLATALTLALNVPTSPVSATQNGAVLTLTSNKPGTSANYALSSATDGDFTIGLSGSAMTGGAAGGAIPGGLNQQYTLDAWGNLTSMGNSGFTQAVNSQNQVSTFLYDAAGRLQSSNPTLLTTMYTYDDDGMLLTSSDGASYIYDAVGARAQVTTSTSSQEYYYFAGQLIATRNPALGVNGWTDYIYAGGQKLAVMAGNQTAAPVYSLPDHLGSEVGSVNNNEMAAAALDYSPFGQVISGSSTDSFIFTGLEHDASGLDHAGFRMYSSGTGRWTTPDPYNGSMSFGNPQTLNRYSYGLNNPIGLVDRSGLNCSTDQSVTVYADGSEGNYISSAVACGFWDAVTVIAKHVGHAFAELFNLGALQFNGNVLTQNTGKIVHTQNKPAAPRPAWNANLPSCWAVGFGAVGNAIKGTLDPRPGLSTGIGSLAGIAGEKPFAVESAEAAPFVLASFDINLVQQLYSEITQPKPCR